MFNSAIFYVFPDVRFSPLGDYYSPLPGYTFSVIEAVSTVFTSTSGIFGFEDGFSPDVRQLSPNYFLSPGEIPGAACSLQFSALLLALVFIIFL